MAKVFFGFDDGRLPGRHEAEFDRSRLRLGALVHVENREIEPKFSSTPTKLSEPHAVSWIAPSQWYVVLTRGYKFSAADLAKLVSAVGSYATADEVRAACNKCIREIPLEDLYLTETREKSVIGQLTTVADRIELAQRLSLSEFSRFLWDQYEPLVVYLMLTCFDVLGQPAQWKDFRSWLDGKEASRIGLADASPVEQSKQLYQAWAERYGVRNSFYRFMDEVLPANGLRLLLSSIEYRIRSNPPELIAQQNGDDGRKKRWLFDIRNRFTHSAQINRGWHPEVFGQQAWPAEAKRQTQARIGKKTWEVVTVEDWPKRLIDTVQCGFAAKIKGYIGRDFTKAESATLRAPKGY